MTNFKNIITQNKLLKRIRFWITRQLYYYKFLYNFYYKFYRKNRGVRLELPNESMQLHIAGDGRAGNTFTTSLVKRLLIEKLGCDIKYSSHLHSTAVMKIAEQFNSIKQIVLIRNPEDQLASSYVKFFALRNQLPPSKLDTNLLKYSVRQYLNYYKYAFDHKEQYKFVIFEDLIQNNKGLANFILDETGYKNKKVTDEDIKWFNDFFKNKEKKKNPLGGSLPNEQKERQKKELKSELLKLKEFKKAEALYHDIVKLKVDLSLYND